jgi:hypothetical protein
VTPTLADIIVGQAATLSAPQPPEALGDYLAGRVGIVALLARLAIQEVERGPAARVWENRTLRALLDQRGGDYEEVLGSDLTALAARPPAGFAWSALDAENAVLRRLLIRLHEAVETRGDVALDREILALYVRMAEARRLELPSAPS